MAEVYLNYIAVPEYVTGLIMTVLTIYLLTSGSKKIGQVSSKLVPVMCFLYFGACGIILLQHAGSILPMLKLILEKAFSPTAAIAGFAGSTALAGFREGTFKGAFITESGLGTAAIPHSLLKQPRLQIKEF